MELNWQEIGFKSGQDWVTWGKSSELEAYYEDLPLLIRVNQLWPNEDILLTYVYENEDEPDWWSEGAALCFWNGFANGFLASWRPIKTTA